MPVEIDDLARAWILLYETKSKHGNDSPESNALFWAYEALDEACSEHPKRALEVIGLISKLTIDDYILANLAAGPLEDLIVGNEEKIIDDIEVLAKKDLHFRRIIGGVWRNSISQPTWDRLQRAMKEE